MTNTEASEGSSAATPEELVRRLRLLSRTAHDFLAARAKELGLGTTDFVALVRAANDDGITGAELARAFEMRSSSVTGLADRLEARGLIARRPHPTDRRTVVLHATRRGRQTVTRALGPLLDSLTALAGEFDGTERSTLAAYLDGIGDALAEAPLAGRPSAGHAAPTKHR